MASFEIKDCPTKLAITETEKGGKKIQTGMLTLDIRNATDRRRTGRIRVEPGSGAKPEWFAIDGAPTTNPREIEQDFAAKGQQSVRINLAVPTGEPPKSLLFNALVTAEDDPDNDFVKGPNVAFDIAPWKAAPKATTKPFPWWIVAVAVVLVLVVGGVGAYFVIDGHGAVDVAGLTVDDAKTKLEKAGTRAEDIAIQNAPTTQGQIPNTVISMSQNGAKVTLLVDPGVKIPSLGPFEATVQAITGVGLVLDQVTNENRTDVAPGIVTRSAPPSGQPAQRGSKVELWVSQRPPICAHATPGHWCFAIPERTNVPLHIDPNVLRTLTSH